MKRMSIAVFLIALSAASWAQQPTKSIEREWLMQQEWHRACLENLPLKFRPRQDRLMNECQAMGRSKSDCEPLVAAASYSALIENYRSFGQCVAQNLPRTEGACYSRAWMHHAECLVVLDANVRGACRNNANADIDKCLSKHVKGEGAKSSLLEWIAAANDYYDYQELAADRFREVVARIRDHGPLPALLSVRDNNAGVVLADLRLSTAAQAREALSRLEEMVKQAGDSPPVRWRAGEARHRLGNFKEAQTHYAAGLRGVTGRDRSGYGPILTELQGMAARREPLADQTWPPPEFGEILEVLKASLPADIRRAEGMVSGIPSVAWNLSTLVYMGEIDTALAGFEVLRAQRKAGMNDAVYKAASSLADSLFNTGQEARLRVWAESLPDDDEKGVWSLQKLAYERLFDGYSSKRRWDDARALMPKLVKNQHREQRLLLNSSGAGRDVEKYAALLASGQLSGPMSWLWMSEFARYYRPVSVVRMVEIAKSLPPPDLKWDSMHLDAISFLFHFGLCEEGARLITPAPAGRNDDRKQQWRDHAQCLVKQSMRRGNTAGAEQAINSFMAKNWKDPADVSDRELLVFIAAHAMNDDDKAEAWVRRFLGDGYDWKNQALNKFAKASDTPEQQRMKERWRLVFTGRLAEAVRQALAADNPAELQALTLMLRRQLRGDQ